MKIILASQSPRRASLLKLVNIDCEIFPSNYDEAKTPGLTVEEQSKEWAYQKAKSVFESMQEDRAVIGADTIVVKDGVIYGKPKDRDEAISMIENIQNDVHQVYTSIAVLIEDRGKVKEFKDIVRTDIYVNKMTKKEIEEYIDYDLPFDKAGAYAIQGFFSKYISRIDGNYSSVVGLPVDRIYTILKENDVFDEI